MRTYIGRGRALSAGVLLAAGSAFGQAIVMGPGNTGFPGSVAPTGSNSIIQQWSTGDPTPYMPPNIYTDDLFANVLVPRVETTSFIGGIATTSNHYDYGTYTTTATTTTINAAIRNFNYIYGGSNDTGTAYCGSSQFLIFTLPAPATVTMSWATNLIGGSAPTSGVMFWDIWQTSPTPGSVAGTSNVDSGTWSGTLAAGQYSMIYTRHDGITGPVSTESLVLSQFTLVAEVIPAPGAAVLLVGIVTACGRRRRHAR